MSFWDDLGNAFSDPFKEFTGAWTKIFTDPGSLNLGNIAAATGWGAPVVDWTKNPEHLGLLAGSAVVAGGIVATAGALGAPLAGGAGTFAATGTAGSAAAGSAVGTGTVLAAAPTLPGAVDASLFAAPAWGPGSGVLLSSAPALDFAPTAGLGAGEGVLASTGAVLPNFASDLAIHDLATQGPGFWTTLSNVAGKVADKVGALGEFALKASAPILGFLGLQNRGGKSGSTTVNAPGAPSNTSGPSIGLNLPGVLPGSAPSAGGVAQAGFPPIAIILLIGAALGLLYLGMKKK